MDTRAETRDERTELELAEEEELPAAAAASASLAMMPLGGGCEAAAGHL